MQIYCEVNYSLLEYLKGSGKRILDCGCGTGVFGADIKRRNNAQVIGITISKKEHEIAKTNLDNVILADLNIYDTSVLGLFDYIVCSHIVEHLYDPWAFLAKLRLNLSESGQLIIALPNVLHWQQRIKFLFGRFRYADQGIMDRTHIRFFDFQSVQQMVNTAGYKIVQCVPDGHFPLPYLRKIIPTAAKLFDKFISKTFPGLFAYQFILVANKQ